VNFNHLLIDRQWMLAIKKNQTFKKQQKNNNNKKRIKLYINTMNLFIFCCFFICLTTFVNTQQCRAACTDLTNCNECSNWKACVSCQYDLGCDNCHWCESRGTCVVGANVCLRGRRAPCPTVPINYVLSFLLLLTCVDIA